MSYDPVADARELAQQRRQYVNVRPERVLYVIGTASAVKIGKTGDVTERFRQIQMMNPETLTLLAVKPEGDEYEFKVHEHFAADRIRGEWFHRSPEIDEYIRLLREAHGDPSTKVKQELSTLV